MRQLCGNAYVALKLSKMGKDFALEPLIHASAIITDENDVGTFIDKAANLKSIVTNDAIPINRKFKVPISYKFYGFMVQCLNEYPRVKDKSDSFYRRQLFVPFEKCFTGVERKHIKRDYLTRPEVLQYVLWRVLNMNYYELSEPDACRIALEECKEYNDPVHQFVEEMLPQAKWGILPFKMLYAAYKCWFKENMPSGTPQGRNSFIKDLELIIKDNPDWECDRKKQYYGGNHMACYEPLIAIYELKDWATPIKLASSQPTPTELYTPMPGQFTKLRFRGLARGGISEDTQDDAAAPEQSTGDDCPITAGA